MSATRLSRYEYASIHEDEEKRLYMDVPEPISRNRTKSDDLLYTIKEGDTIHSIAFRFYKDMLINDPTREVRPSKFYWVICQVNDIIDPTEDLPIGKEIIIPGVSVLNDEILIPPPFLVISRIVSS